MSFRVLDWLVPGSGSLLTMALPGQLEQVSILVSGHVDKTTGESAGHCHPDQPSMEQSRLSHLLHSSGEGYRDEPEPEYNAVYQLRLALESRPDLRSPGLDSLRRA